jgi:hypothetical protein
MRIFVMAAVAVLLAACAREPATGISDEQFIDVVVELRRAAVEHREDHEAFQARKDAILQQSGVEEEQLRQYVEVRGRDLQHMAEVWATINERLSESADIQ